MSDHEDAGKTRVMPRVETNPEPARGPGGKPKGNRTNLYVGLGVLGGIVVGGVIAWALVAMNASKPLVTSAVPTATVEASATAPASSTAATAPGSFTSAAPAIAPAPDTTAPTTPKITFPPTNYWVSPDDPKVEIKWSRVSDPSGVSYVLEFSSWLGGGAGWTDSKRTALVKRLYYDRTVTGLKERFRVIAIDGAGNESGPSKYYFLIKAGSASEAASLNAGGN